MTSTNDPKETRWPSKDLLERTKRWVRERLEELYSLIEQRDRLRAALEGGEGQQRASRRASRQRGRPNTERSADHAAGNLGEWNTGSHAFDANTAKLACGPRARARHCGRRRRLARAVCERPGQAL